MAPPDGRWGQLTAENAKGEKNSNNRRGGFLIPPSFLCMAEEASRKIRKIRTMAPSRLVIFLSCWLVALCSVAVNAGHENRDVTTIAADRLKLLIDSGEKFILIDLRPAQEFQLKRLAGSRNWKNGSARFPSPAESSSTQLSRPMIFQTRCFSFSKMSDTKTSRLC
jgi:hypothetical protein